MFDGLTQWDLSSADKPSVIIPGLATEWAADAKDRTKWIFKLRKGAKFHDGTDVNADAIVFNFEKVLKKDAPHYDARLVAQTAPRMPTVTGARKIDDYTIEVQTSEPDSFVPINLSNLFIASPDRVGEDQELGRVRQGAGRQRAVEVRAPGAARAPRAGEVRRLLGREARAEDRPRGADPDAGRQHARQRAALRPGGLDRGGAGRRHRAAEEPRHADHLQPLPAHLAVAVLLRAGAPDRRTSRCARR